MKKFPILAIFLLTLAFVPPLLAQEEGSEAQTAATFQGELVSVDTAAQTLIVRDAEGTEMEFAYNEQTQVSGADQEIGGLATRSGSMVEVSYIEEAGSKTALQINVKQK